MSHYRVQGSRHGMLQAMPLLPQGGRMPFWVSVQVLPLGGPRETALRKKSEKGISKLQDRVNTELVQAILDALASQVSSKESGFIVSL
eukprot:CAMPEP_0194551454 /NCGR_PEP_ID=MMETSP0253-20130528/96230_1 /TAXON_ID=2966 /ORGANISM="Noctiluca scintillans" /LENGTH=87 /DNA_ID=CAMNT_0039398913 /DNA_START=366 /DNA_END=630 /DNA_ORIENTATION=-